MQKRKRKKGGHHTRFRINSRRKSHTPQSPLADEERLIGSFLLLFYFFCVGVERTYLFPPNAKSGFSSFVWKKIRGWRDASRTVKERKEDDDGDKKSFLSSKFGGGKKARTMSNVPFLFFFFRCCQKRENKMRGKGKDGIKVAKSFSLPPRCKTRRHTTQLFPPYQKEDFFF